MLQMAPQSATRGRGRPSSRKWAEIISGFNLIYPYPILLLFTNSLFRSYIRSICYRLLHSCDEFSSKITLPSEVHANWRSTTISANYLLIISPCFQFALEILATYLSCLHDKMISTSALSIVNLNSIGCIFRNQSKPSGISWVTRKCPFDKFTGSKC